MKLKKEKIALTLVATTIIFLGVALLNHIITNNITF